MIRKMGYQWHLRLRMAEKGMYATTDLVNDATNWIAARGTNAWFVWAGFGPRTAARYKLIGHSTFIVPGQ